MSNSNARFVAYKALEDIILSDAFSNITLNKLFKQTSLSDKDKKYATELVYGTIKNKLYLEHILKHYAKSRIKPKIKIVIIMSIYQIINMDKTPDFATVNEAVNIAKKIGGVNAGKFVNGILRNIIRSFDKDNLVYKNEKEKFCIENSCPVDLYNILANQYGEVAEEIIKSFNKKSYNSIRYNSNKINLEQLLTYFTSKEVNAKISTICEDCLIIDQLDINDPYFQKGNYIIQDEASALVGCSLEKNKELDYNILDVCAAPGGKSLHIATKYPNSKIISCDKYEHKLKLIEQNAKKLDINNIYLKKQDATEFNKEFSNKFDIVICDVPCSGIGVIKNKPEIKYKISNNYVEDIAKLQLEILENSKQYVKSGGLLLYSTCTIDKRENVENINKFLAENKNYKLEKININSEVKEINEGIINILPHEYDCDGFFIAKMRKMED